MKKSELLELLQELAMEDLEDGADIADHPCTLAAECIKSLDSEANKWAVAYRQSKEEAQRLQAELRELLSRIYDSQLVTNNKAIDVERWAGDALSLLQEKGNE